ncbi:MAG: DUF3786 domain-containing protein [Clostridiales bacterium]|jgi:hypothetical protein|nr:DUF3786 domain-containing protein [Clostridiales bacterium]
MQYKQAYLEALHGFANKDPFHMADLSGAQYRSGGGLEFSYCGHPCTVTYPAGEILFDTWREPPHEEKIIILQYLAGAAGIPPRGHWLSFLELPGGPHHFAPFQQEAIFPLAKQFGAFPEQFRRTAIALGGTTTDMGHTGLVIPAFPLIPLAFILWAGDDEFPAAANILFDASASAHLPTATLYMLGIAVSQRLLAKGNVK